MKPIEVLKKGLAKLHNQIREQKARLDVELKASRPISEVDQDWLDGDGNLVDEEKVVEILDSASDYERGLDRLDSQAKPIVQKLQKLAGGPKSASLVSGQPPSQPILSQNPYPWTSPETYGLYQSRLYSFSIVPLTYSVQQRARQAPWDNKQGF
jgi:hypothetical protein